MRAIALVVVACGPTARAPAPPANAMPEAACAPAPPPDPEHDAPLAPTGATSTDGVFRGTAHVAHTWTHTFVAPCTSDSCSEMTNADLDLTVQCGARPTPVHVMLVDRITKQPGEIEGCIERQDVDPDYARTSCELRATSDWYPSKAPHPLDLRLDSDADVDVEVFMTVSLPPPAP